MIPNDEYIDKCMKVFYRFLKEEGIYRMMIKYLFYPGRTMMDFYADVKRLYENNYDFRDILHITYTLGDNWSDRCGFTYHGDIEPFSAKFVKYWIKHSIRME